MITLAEFLLARIAEDEEAAKRAAFGYGGKWADDSDDAEGWSVVHADGKRDMVGCEDGDVTRHIARHDPARVLAECEAKRQIVRGYQHEVRDYQAGYTNVQPGHKTMKHLTLPYADHPDYREE